MYGYHETNESLRSRSTLSVGTRRRYKLAQDLRMSLDTEEEGEMRLMKRALVHSLDQLPPKQKQYLTCYLVEDLTMIQIAKKYGVDKTTVSRTIKRARVNLWKYLRYPSIRFLNDDSFVDKLTRKR